jgi:hypothetical protein
VRTSNVSCGPVRPTIKWAIVHVLDNPQAPPDTPLPPCSQPDHRLPPPIPRRRTGTCPDHARRIDPVTEQFRVVALCRQWHDPCSMSQRVRRLGGPPETRPRTRLFERRDGGSGQKARAGRQPDSRQANPRNGQTPRASREGFLAVKVEGGGDVKAFPRCAGGRPGGAEAHEGRGSVEAQPVSTDTAFARGAKP